jgi:hypothetical protein
MTYLTRDAILGAPDLPTEDVDVPEWGGVVRVRGMSGAARDEWERARVEREPNLRARVASLCIVDEHSAPLFSAVDVARLGQKSAKALEKVLEVAVRLSGLAGDDGEVEAGKDSEDEPSGSPGSTSPTS